ncbi:UNKNOWN [Stylonychia lemnae]|uniref:Uncharacterized protein n=1 Tax=Stylonychia lemnae TaxID=5949 RepID=A0A077ZYK5_STYLE|nr:UNKNOWN [Stylonychia lemnae]|eukprot:CDW74697.1 UNKNOWN [Stylonychia lemnae]
MQNMSSEQHAMILEKNLNSQREIQSMMSGLNYTKKLKNQAMNLDNQTDKLREISAQMRNRDLISISTTLQHNNDDEDNKKYQDEKSDEDIIIKSSSNFSFNVYKEEQGQKNANENSNKKAVNAKQTEDKQSVIINPKKKRYRLIKETKKVSNYALDDIQQSQILTELRLLQTFSTETIYDLIFLHLQQKYIGLSFLEKEQIVFNYLQDNQKFFIECTDLIDKIDHEQSLKDLKLEVKKQGIIMKDKQRVVSLSGNCSHTDKL